MKIKALETIKHHPLYMAAGEQKTVDDGLGDYLVGRGWCENVDTGETSDRTVAAVSLQIDNAASAATDTGL